MGVTALCAVLAVAVSGCVQSNRPATTKRPAKMSSAEADKKIAKIDKSADEVRAEITGKTLLFFDRGHGTQVAYYSPEGVEYLWYPGNARIVPGQWKIDPARKTGYSLNTVDGVVSRKINNATICFKYGLKTWNPVTRQAGGKWKCTATVLWLGHTVEAKDGDVFGLSKRPEVPFKLKKPKTSIEALRASCKTC